MTRPDMHQIHTDDEPKCWTTRAWYAVAYIGAACIAWGIVAAIGGRV